MLVKEKQLTKGQKIPNHTDRPVLITGHRNPDTDSVCAAIGYARLKNKLGDKQYIPCRAGKVNAETKFVLDYFGVEPPRLLEDVRTQVSDVEFRKTPGVSKNLSLKRAWKLMAEGGVVTIPAVTEHGKLEGLITVGDIAKSYMNVYDSSILSKAKTQYKNIVETLEATLLVGDEEKYCTEGKVLIAAANPEMMQYYIAEHDVVILGNRAENQLCALEKGADCIIICEGANVSPTIRTLAEDRGMIIMVTSYDAYTAARLINQSMPISYFMKTEKLITFEEDDYIDDIKEVMASKRHRDFPVLSKDGRYLGMISRRNLLGSHGKQVILVDHNEATQAVAGVENAEILEIIDHHRLGTIQTMGPVYFRNQPLGCTSTIIYLMYKENGVEIDPQTAGVLVSAIVSDTLLFQSPTCTEIDKKAGYELAELAGIDIEKYAVAMFSAASNLKGKQDREIFYQDFKKFTASKLSFGVAQINSLNAEELEELKPRMLAYMTQGRNDNQLDMVFFMLTNILTQDTVLLCSGVGSGQLAERAFGLSATAETEDSYSLRLPGVVSRKKQLVPPLVMAEQDV